MSFLPDLGTRVHSDVGNGSNAIPLKQETSFPSSLALAIVQSPSPLASCEKVLSFKLSILEKALTRELPSQVPAPPIHPPLSIYGWWGLADGAFRYIFQGQEQES